MKRNDITQILDHMVMFPVTAVPRKLRNKRIKELISELRSY